MQKYSVSKILRHRIGLDGEGIRTLVLMQGCLLRCIYCPNSFTWDESKEASLMTAKELYERIIVDRPYILATRGGVTLGGGEPLMYPNIFMELRCLMDDNMTLYAETSFNIPYENIKIVAEYIDRFIVDIKTVDGQLYNKYTGGDLQIALDNIGQFINEFGTEKLTVRIPIIPNYNNKRSQMESKEKLESIGVVNFDLFTYVEVPF